MAAGADDVRTVVVKGNDGAGLGDKLRALMVATMYAKVSGRTLAIDWGDTTYRGWTRNDFPRCCAAMGLAIA